MKDLIGRVEAATEGSRELDESVAFAVGWETKPLEGVKAPLWRPPDKSLGWSTAPIPHYTTSLDAALQLVPGEMEADIQTTGYAGVHKGGIKAIWYESNAATPELALVAACLKALQSETS